MGDNGLTFAARVERAGGDKSKFFRAYVEVFKPGGGGFLLCEFGSVAEVIETVARKGERYGLDYDDVRLELEGSYAELGEAI